MDTESVVSSVSSITPQSRGKQVCTSTAKQGGGMSLFGSGNLITIVHILSEITVFVAMGMWVRSRTNSLQKQVNDLRDIVEQQTAVINDHTEALQILMNSRVQQPSYFQPAQSAGNIVRPPPQQTENDNSHIEPVNNSTPPSQLPPDFMSFGNPGDKQDSQEQELEVPRVEMLSPIQESTESVESGEDEILEDDIETGPNETELDQELEAELAALQ